MSGARLDTGPKRFTLRRRVERMLLVLANMVLYPLSRLVPRDPRRWAFGHTKDAFGDNPKYLFLWMALHRPDIRIAWLTGSRETLRMLRDAGYTAHLRWSPKGMIAAQRSRVFVYSHNVGNVNVALSNGALRVNLWHGVGLKAVHFGHRTGVAVRLRELGKTFVGRFRVHQYLAPADVFVTTSDFTQAHFSGQFELPREKCPQLGYPRLDCAADPKLAEAARTIDRKAGFALNPDGFAEIYIYVPTYRDSQRPFLDQALPDLARLSEALRARNALLYVKPHPRTPAATAFGHDNIRRWPDAIDFNTYLAEFKGLITDYSSVLYDYLFVRPTGAILYTFDYAEYQAADRALLYPFDENVAGLRIETFDALCDALRDGAAFDPALSANVERIRQRFWGGSARPASPAIVDYVEALAVSNRSK